MVNGWYRITDPHGQKIVVEVYRNRMYNAAGDNLPIPKTEGGFLFEEVVVLSQRELQEVKEDAYQRGRQEAVQGNSETLRGWSGL